MVDFDISGKKILAKKIFHYKEFIAKLRQLVLEAEAIQKLALPHPFHFQVQILDFSFLYNLGLFRFLRPLVVSMRCKNVYLRRYFVCK